MSLLREVLQAHGELPRYLRAWFVAPAIVLSAIPYSILFSLPPGPLCDEGMVLFMEGGCDYGRTNVFFFAKVALLIGINAVLAMAWFKQQIKPIAFVPHFAVLLVVAGVWNTDFDCGDYYGHPNGTTGQMVLEAAAFAALGLALFRRYRNGQSWRLLALVATLWNLTHVAVFYSGLLLTEHWTWTHTWWTVAVLVLCALGVGWRSVAAADAPRFAT